MPTGKKGFTAFQPGMGAKGAHGGGRKGRHKKRKGRQ